jgi:hypothetical protein
MDSDVLVQFWVEDADDVPDERAGRIDWLYDWWERIDQWVERNREAETSASGG